MNYSAMIEEKKLKKGFIIATLISTIAGTFTTSLALHEKIQEKRDRAKQKKLDTKQDDQIQELKGQLAQIQNGDGPDRPRRRRTRDDYEDEEDFACSARRSKAMIERTYEDNLRRMGSAYAQGDMITENKLQAQVIQLQQTVINVLQDALYNGRSLTDSDIRRLVNAQNAARDGSLDALQGQYSRMLVDRNSSGNLFIGEGRSPLPRQFIDSRARRASLPPVLKYSTQESSSLFCRYSETLQFTSRSLGPTFSPRGSQCCPSCSTIIPVDTRDLWVFSMRSSSGKNLDYSMDARFVVKCHTRDGRFACFLCNQNRDMDCVCRDVDALVKHLGNMHSADEFAAEVDLIDSRDSVDVKELVLA